jgi:poly(A) polymerase
LFRALPKLELYLTGGMVRDTIIKHPTSKDYDFIARGVPLPELIEALKKLGDLQYTGRNFGVLKFTPHDSTLTEAIDIALPRTEHAEGTGGYRDVTTKSNSDLPVAEDLARRDLTINAMAWDVREQKLIDQFHGQDDLRDKIIRAVGEPADRIQEDYSRMLRALRFACRFNFQIEQKTWDAIKSKIDKLNEQRPIRVVDIIHRKINLATKKDEIAKLEKQLAAQTEKDPNETKIEFVTPRETVAKELLKALHEDPVRALELYDESGAFRVLMPEVLAMKNCEQPAAFHSEGDVWTHTKMMLEKIDSKEFRSYFKGVHITGEFVLGVILHDAGKPVTKQTPEADGVDRVRFNGHDEAGATIAGDVANRLKLSDDQKAMIKFMIAEHMIPMAAPNIYNLRAHTFAKRFIDSPYSQELLMLFYLDSICSVRADGGDTLQNFRDTLKRIEEIKQIREKQPTKIIDGKKIMDVLQIKGGPLVGCITLVISELADSGKINSEEEAVALLEKYKGLFKSYLDKIMGSDREQIAQTIVDQIVKFERN